MELAIILARLAEAERSIARTAEHIQHQSEIATALERDGHPGIAALTQEILRQFEDIQVANIASRDSLLKELKDFRK
jgi:cell division protein FtsX